MTAFTIFGKAEPAGSKSAFVMPAPCPSCGKVVRAGRAIVTDANPKSARWKKEVAEQAAMAYSGPKHAEAVEVTITVYVTRPKRHFNSKGLVKPNAPALPAVKPDVLKLARGIEDALTGIAYEDDALIVSEHIYKRYGVSPRVEIEVEEEVL